MPIQVDVLRDTRFTERGISVHCIYEDPHDIQLVEVILEDYTGRTDRVTVRSSTGMILVPFGELGTMAYDPVGERGDRKTVFRQRPILSMAEILTYVRLNLRQPADLRILRG